MNTAIKVSFATPFISSITRDESFVHSPMPIDGALAYAAYWNYAWQSAPGDVMPTEGRLSESLLEEVVYPELDRVFAKASVGQLLGTSRDGNEIYLVSSGYPMLDERVYFKIGARYVHLSGESLVPEYEVQPIRRRVIPSRLTVLGISPITSRGVVPKEGIDTSRGGLKGIDNRIATWKIFDYVWYAEVRDSERLSRLLDILRFQGMGKKRSAGFGRVVGCQIIEQSQWAKGLEFEQDPEHPVFLKHNGQSVLMRPLPYREITRSEPKVALTNLMIEYGCGSKPPYWNAREVVIREGTTFNF